MFQQALFLPALHLRAEVPVRRQLCLQRACASLKAAPTKLRPEPPWLRTKH
jgi:hypothetical protein